MAALGRRVHVEFGPRLGRESEWICFRCITIQTGPRYLTTMRFEHTAIVDGSPEEVFGLTQDYARRLTWDPFLREAVLLDGASAPGVGVRARCVARSGLEMETEYVSFVPSRVT